MGTASPSCVPSDGRNLGTFPTGPGPYAIAFDGANIWVTNIPDGTVSKR